MMLLPVMRNRNIQGQRCARCADTIAQKHMASLQDTRRHMRLNERKKRMSFAIIMFWSQAACLAFCRVPHWNAGAVHAFTVPPSRRWRGPQTISLPSFRDNRTLRPRSRLCMVNFDSSDPFEILNLSPSPNLDKKEIKRAYKRMALKFHPDVLVTQQSTTEEKRKANDRFAKINWAYETLTGKRQDEARATAGTSTSGGSGGYTPPHRRSGSSYASGGKRTGMDFSTDWRDYMPRDDDDRRYDAGGDSFGAIFGDLLSGVAGAAAAGGGGSSVFRDFVEFLESNVDGYSTSSADDDSQLRILLQTGSLEEVAEEMDDTDLVVQQLSTKSSGIEEELVMAQADRKGAARYVEKMELEEKIAELQARKSVVEGYLKKARKRLLSLQSRYKELIIAGDNDVRSGGRSRSSNPTSGSSSAYSSSYRSASKRTERPNGTTSSSRAADSTNGDDWKHQGFGSSGRRGRGSSRRSRRPSSSGSGDRATQSTSSSQRETSTEASSYTSRSSRPATPSIPMSSVPPHRRAPADTRQAQDDRRRLRELKVDEEFEKLKNELGL